MAEEKWQWIQEVGGVGAGELEFLLALTRARHASGDEAGAHKLLQHVFRRISIRAERIIDTALRKTFLTQGPSVVQAHDLAHAWSCEKCIIT